MYCFVDDVQVYDRQFFKINLNLMFKLFLYILIKLGFWVKVQNINQQFQVKTRNLLFIISINVVLEVTGNFLKNMNPFLLFSSQMHARNSYH